MSNTIKPGIKVFYSYPGIISGLDEDIRQSMKNIGYKMWASGYNLVENVRDLAFDPVEENDAMQKRKK